jgi:serine protease AprX
MKRWSLLAWMVLLPAMVLGNDAKLAPELKQPVSDGAVSVIVQYKAVPGKTQLDEIQRWGGKPGVKLALINAVSAQLPTSAIIPLSNEDAVAYISPDRSVRSHADNAASAVLADFALGLGFDGSGVGVAVIDSGIHDSDRLRNTAGESRILFSRDLVGGVTSNAYGHGTLVAGIIGGNAGVSVCPSCATDVRGIAPNVSLIDLRVLDNSGSGTDSAVIAAIQAAVQLKGAYNIRVLNLSLGRPVQESYALDPLCQAVEQAWKAGIVVVVSAGNKGRDNSAGTNGYATIEAPGNDPYVITVGAINTKGTSSRADDVMTSFSAKGPTAIDHIVKPDLVAPGNGVTALPQPIVAIQPQLSALGSSSKGNTLALSGTSAASAVVSGAAALILQQDPTLTPDQVKARLMITADKNLPSYTAVVNRDTTYNLQNDVFTVGAGYLNLQAALTNTDVAPGVAKSPTAHYDSSSGNAYFLADSTTPWGNSAVWSGATAIAGADTWSPSAVWGENVFLATKIGPNNAMWGGSTTIAPNNAMWGGSTTIAPNNAMWGGSTTIAPNNAMWGGSTTIAPNNAMWGGSTTIAPNNAMWGGSTTIAPNNAMWGGAPPSLLKTRCGVAQ